MSGNFCFKIQKDGKIRFWYKFANLTSASYFFDTNECSYEPYWKFENSLGDVFNKTRKKMEAEIYKQIKR